MDDVLMVMMCGSTINPQSKDEDSKLAITKVCS